MQTPESAKTVGKRKIGRNNSGVPSNYLFLFLYFRIHNIYVTISINQNIARKNVPNNVSSISISAFVVVALLRSGLHLFGQLQIAPHVVGKVFGAHRRFLGFFDFPHRTLHSLFVKLIQKCHCSSCFCLCKDKKNLANDIHGELNIMFFYVSLRYSYQKKQRNASRETKKRCQRINVSLSKNQCTENPSRIYRLKVVCLSLMPYELIACAPSAYRSCPACLSLVPCLLIAGIFEISKNIYHSTISCSESLCIKGLSCYGR